MKAGSPEDAQMHARALTVPLGTRLVQLAREYADMDDVLAELAGAISGDGWSTKGTSGGGSGNCR